MQNPPRVSDIQDYWMEAPEQPSERCLYWEARIRGGWRRNRRIGQMGYWDSAEYFGVWIWEWLHIIGPLLRDLEES